MKKFFFFFREGFFFKHLFDLFFCARSSLPLVAVSRGCSSPQRPGFSLPWLLLWSAGSGRLDLSGRSCGLAVAAPGLCGAGPVLRVHGLRRSVAFCVLCIGRRILVHCTPREVTDLVWFGFLNLSSAVISSITVALDSCVSFFSVSL